MKAIAAVGDALGDRLVAGEAELEEAEGGLVVGHPARGDAVLVVDDLGLQQDVDDVVDAGCLRRSWISPR